MLTTAKRKKIFYIISMQVTVFSTLVCKMGFVGCGVRNSNFAERGIRQPDDTQNEASGGHKKAVNWFQFALVAGNWFPLHHTFQLLLAHFCGSNAFYFVRFTCSTFILCHTCIRSTFFSRFNGQPNEDGNKRNIIYIFSSVTLCVNMQCQR